jgi:hypothetical protein
VLIKKRAMTKMRVRLIYNSYLKPTSAHTQYTTHHATRPPCLYPAPSPSRVKAQDPGSSKCALNSPITRHHPFTIPLVVHIHTIPTDTPSYLDPLCPFSAKITRSLTENVIPLLRGGKYDGQLSLIPRIYPQPLYVLTPETGRRATADGLATTIRTSIPRLHWYLAQSTPSCSGRTS